MDIDNLQPGPGGDQAPAMLPKNLQQVDSVLGSFVCAWNLKKFSQVDSTPGKSCRSKVFKLVEGRPYLDLTILFYPGGRDEEQHQDSTCYLQFRKSHHGMFVRTVISYMTSDGRVIAQRSNPWVVLGRKRICEGPEGVFRQELLQKVEGDDVLLVTAEVEYSSSDVNVVGDEEEEDKYMTSIDQAGYLVDVFNNMVARTNTDFVIICSGKIHNVHKNVLIANSRVFADMLLNNGDGIASIAHLVVNDFGADVVDAMVFFLYHQRLSNLSTKLAIDVIRIAHRYGLDELKRYCYGFMVAVAPSRNENIRQTSRDLVYRYNNVTKLGLTPDEITIIGDFLKNVHC